MKKSISDIKNDVPVSEVVRRHVALKKVSGRLTGLCPFHSEKTPSFTVDDAQGFYHCFGCGAHGDVLDFLTKIENIPLQEGMKKLSGVTALPKVVVADKPVYIPVYPVPEGKELAIGSYWLNTKGEILGRWPYYDNKGQLLGYVVRFANAKAVPFQWCGKDGWQSVGFDAPRPLYNLFKLVTAKGIKCIVEGEKCADTAQLLFPSFVCTTWMGGALAVKQSDWTPFQGEEVYFLRDNDEPGKKAEQDACEILSKLGCTIQIFKDNALAGQPEGWDIADTTLAGKQLEDWLKASITEYQRGGADVVPSQDSQKSAQSDKPFSLHYRPLGLTGSDFLLYNYHSGRVEKKTAEGFSESYCRTLVCGDINHWRRVLKISAEDKIAWKSIGGVIAQDFYKLGQFDSNRIRGLGCWIDNRRVVFNAGEFLYVDGRKIPINEFESHFVYIRSEDILPNMDEELSREDLALFEQLCNMFAWEYPACGTLLAGWLMVAPICGALKWRPHIYITGMSGTGKSTIYDHILARTLGNGTTAALGDSSKAGLAQSGKIDALPIIFDEIENDSKADEMRNEAVLKMARYSSSNQKGKSLKGRADQSGAEEYTCRSAFCFSSITPSVKHYADYTRITLLPLTVNHSADKMIAIHHFDKITQLISQLMGDDEDDYAFSNKFITYATRNVMNIIISYKILKPMAHKTLTGFTARIADQIGMLLAGYWAYKSSAPITPQEAATLLAKFKWEDLIPSKKQENQMILISKLKQHPLYVRNENSQKQYTRSIARLIDYISYSSSMSHKDDLYFDKEYAVTLLQDIGIKIQDSFVYISNSSDVLSNILQGTQWVNNWAHSLKAIDGANPSEPKWFGKAIGYQRCTKIPLGTFISEEGNDL